MSGNLAPVLKPKYFNAGGTAALAGGKLYSFAAGSATPLVTYTDSTLGTPNTNPVVLDANGEASVWLDPTLNYKFILQDSSGVQQWSVDQVAGAPGSALFVPQWSTNVSYSAGNVVADASGEGILYVSLTNGNLGNALTSAANWRVYDGKVRTVTSNTSLLVTDSLIRSNTTAGALTHTLPACSTTPIGKEIEIKDVGTGGNATTFKGNGTDTIDGNVTADFTLLQYNYARVKNNGTSWDIIARYPHKKRTYQVFSTNGTFTWTRPAGCTQIDVEAYGAGAGGGGADGGGGTGAGAGGGGGGGGYAFVRLPLSTFSAATADVTVGNGGGGGTASGGGNGNDGGLSKFQAISAGTVYAQAAGGSAGIGDAAPQATDGFTEVAGAGGAGTTGTLLVTGQPGMPGLALGTNSSGGGGMGGRGAGPSGGGGGQTIAGNSAGTAGAQPGGGGSGANVSASATDRAGGSGGVGMVIVWEDYG